MDYVLAWACSMIFCCTVIVVMGLCGVCLGTISCAILGFSSGIASVLIVDNIKRK